MNDAIFTWRQCFIPSFQASYTDGWTNQAALRLYAYDFLWYRRWKAPCDKIPPQGFGYRARRTLVYFTLSIPSSEHFLGFIFIRFFLKLYPSKFFRGSNPVGLRSSGRKIISFGFVFKPACNLALWKFYSVIFLNDMKKLDFYDLFLSKDTLDSKPLSMENIFGTNPEWSIKWAWDMRFGGVFVTLSFIIALKSYVKHWAWNSNNNVDLHVISQIVDNGVFSNLGVEKKIVLTEVKSSQIVKKKMLSNATYLRKNK